MGIVATAGLATTAWGARRLRSSGEIGVVGPPNPARQSLPRRPLLAAASLRTTATLRRRSPCRKSSCTPAATETLSP